MNDITVAEKQNMAVSLDAEINELTRISNTAIYELANRLKKVRDLNVYSELGYDTFAQYVASKGMSYKTVMAWIHVYEVFVDRLKYQLDELVSVGWTKLQVIAPVVKNKTREEANEWVVKARELSRSDLGLETGEAPEVTSMPTYKCPKCGKWIVNQNLQICTCKT